MGKSNDENGEVMMEINISQWIKQYTNIIVNNYLGLLL